MNNGLQKKLINLNYVVRELCMGYVLYFYVWKALISLYAIVVIAIFSGA